MGRWGGPLVLVIDDDDGIRGVLTDVLAWFGCHALTSADGEGVIDAPWLGQVQLALVDQQLGHRDGRKLAGHLAARGVPVTLMSGHFDAKGPTLLAKPFDMETIQGLLEARGLYPTRGPVVPRTGSEEENTCDVYWFSQESSGVAPATMPISAPH